MRLSVLKRIDHEHDRQGKAKSISGGSLRGGWQRLNISARCTKADIATFLKSIC